MKVYVTVEWYSRFQKGFKEFVDFDMVQGLKNSKKARFKGLILKEWGFRLCDAFP